MDSSQGRRRREGRPGGGRWLGALWPVLVAPLLVFWDGLLGRVSYSPGDGYLLFIPWFTDNARAWLSGHLPTWNPWSQAGMPLLGSTQSGALYPPNLVFLVLPPILANNITIVITFLVAGVGGWLLARLLTGDDVAAAVGGLGFGLCTFLFAHIGHQSMDAGAAWLPWMLYCFELLRRRVSPGRVLGGAAVVALGLLAGHSQVFFTDLLFLAAYAAGEALLGKPDRPLSGAGIAVLMVGAGLGLAAVQLVPTIPVVRDSVRATITYADVAGFSLPKSHTPLLLFPFLFGDPGFRGGPYLWGYGGLWSPTELSGYPGMVLLVLAASGLATTLRSRQARALLAVGLLALVLAYGPSTPLGRLVYHLPVYGQFRAWGRYVLGLDLAVPMLAAFGVAALRSRAAGHRLVPVLLAVATAGAVLATAAVVPKLAAVRQYIPGGHPARDALLLPCLAAVGGVVCVAALLRFRKVGAILTLLAVSLDLYVCFGGYYQWRQADYSTAQLTSLFSPSTPFAWGPVVSTPGGIDRFLYIGANIAPMVPNWVEVTEMKKIFTVNSNDALLNQDFAEATGLDAFGQVHLTADLWRPTSWVLDLLRVSTLVVDLPTTNGGPPGGSLLSGGTPIFSTMERFSYTPRLPEAFVVGAVRKETFAQALKALHGVDPFDAAAEAIVDTPCACPSGSPGSVGTVSSVQLGMDTDELSVTASRPGVVVLSQAYAPGWVATVGGRSEPVVRVDGLVQGVPVPAGTHRVELTYHAPGLPAGFALTLATALALLAAVVAAALRRRRSPGPGGAGTDPGDQARRSLPAPA